MQPLGGGIRDACDDSRLCAASATAPASLAISNVHRCCPWNPSLLYSSFLGLRGELTGSRWKVRYAATGGDSPRGPALRRTSGSPVPRRTERWGLGWL